MKLSLTRAEVEDILCLHFNNQGAVKHVRTTPHGDYLMEVIISLPRTEVPEPESTMPQEVVNNGD